MATIVKDSINDKHYILVGAGFGQSDAGSSPNALTGIGNSGGVAEAKMAAVTDASGEITWVPSMHLTVVSVDGKPCGDLLADFE